jgi:hypothetical protein
MTSYALMDDAVVGHRVLVRVVGGGMRCVNLTVVQQHYELFLLKATGIRHARAQAYH